MLAVCFAVRVGKRSLVGVTASGLEDVRYVIGGVIRESVIVKLYTALRVLGCINPDRII